MGVARDQEASGVDPSAFERLELLEQDSGIDHHPGADYRRAVPVENSGRHEMQGVLLVVDHDRVSGVVAALVADDEVGLTGQQVGDLALALVAPLEADESRARQRSVPRPGGGEEHQRSIRKLMRT